MYIAFASEKLKHLTITRNSLPILLVVEKNGLVDLRTQKGRHFIKKINAILYKMSNLRLRNFRPNFLKNVGLLFLVATFFL